MVDAIRTIEENTTHGEWALYFGGDECTWEFAGKLLERTTRL